MSSESTTGPLDTRRDGMGRRNGTTSGTHPDHP